MKLNTGFLKNVRLSNSVLQTHTIMCNCSREAGRIIAKCSSSYKYTIGMCLRVFEERQSAVKVWCGGEPFHQTSGQQQVSIPARTIYIYIWRVAR